MQFFVIDELYGKVQDKGWRGRSRWDIHQNIKILFWNKGMKGSKSTMIVVYRIKISKTVYKIYNLTNRYWFA